MWDKSPDEDTLLGSGADRFTDGHVDRQSSIRCLQAPSISRYLACAD